MTTTVNNYDLYIDGQKVSGAGFVGSLAPANKNFQRRDPRPRVGSHRHAGCTMQRADAPALSRKAVEVLRWRLTRFYSTEYANTRVAKTEDARQVEAVLHELAHAAVLGYSAPAYGKLLSRRISARFDAFECRAAADRSECAALAVEILAARAIGLRIDERELLDMTEQGFRSGAVFAIPEVNRHLGTKITCRRAAQVIKWIGLSPKEQRT